MISYSELVKQDTLDSLQQTHKGIWSETILRYEAPTTSSDYNVCYPHISYTVPTTSSAYSACYACNYAIPTTVIQTFSYPTTEINIDYSNSGDYWNVAYWNHYYKYFQPSQIQWVSSQGVSASSVYTSLTAEEKAKRLLDQQERDRKAVIADSRADLLLASLLTPQQATQYREKQHFELVINGKVYRMNKGRTGNVQLIENGKPVAQYCAHPEMYVPHGDTLVAQMMMLKTDEAAFLKVANRTALV